MPSVEDLQQQIDELRAQVNPPPKPPPLLDHQPKPGTWAGDGRTAVCRHCDQPIRADDAHQWLGETGLGCPSRQT